MEPSILKSTKKMLGIEADYVAFDGEIIPHINAALSTLSQIGIGDATPIEDDEATWEDLNLPNRQLSMVKTYIHMKVKLAFDPPGTSYLIDVAKTIIAEQEWRLREYAESTKTWPVEVLP